MEEEWLVVGESFELSEFLGGMVPIGVPFDAPRDFKLRVYAAAHSYISGNKSVDYFLKRYGDLIEFERPSAQQRALCAFLRGVLSEARSVYEEIVNGVERNTYLGLFAAEMCLGRVLSSIRMSAMMLINGYLFEAAAIMRIVIEQIAWAWAIHERDDDGIFSVPATKSISALKELSPRAGRRYALLSDYTHINPNLQGQYIDFSEEYAAVMSRQPERSAEMAVLLGLLVDDYRVVTERVSFEYFKNPKVWVANSDGKLVLSESRPLLESIEQFRNVAYKGANKA